MKQIFHNFKLAGFTDPVMEVSGGKIIALAERSGENVSAGTDLNGQWVLPSFVDSHCHILPTGLDLQRLHLGSCSSPSDVLELVSNALKDVPSGRWLQAVHYDQNKFPDGEHLNKSQLDAISDSVPILLRHVNGHASVANSAALRAAGVGADIQNPAGGTFVRDASGALSGVLLEDAHDFVTSKAPEPSIEEMVEAILAASRSMASYGITSAADMMTGRWHLVKELEAYRLAAERGSPVRFSLYMQWATVLGPRATKWNQIKETESLMRNSDCKIAGVKIFADGAIGSRTAAIYGQYSGSSGSDDEGQLIYSPERLTEMVQKATDHDYRVAVHAIGDRAVDHVLSAFVASGQASRHRLEHAMILSDDQISAIKNAGCPVTMQPEFLIRFGHAYQKQLGLEKASKLNRIKSLLDAGIPLALNSDRPIVAGNPWDGISCATQRPEGFDPSENISPGQAFDGYTKDGARLCGDPGLLGELRVGAFADFCTYSEDPMTSESPKVAATYKGAHCVFSS
jgi:predicted amidohydrolase YtcJ